jgi:hypothetical protein
VAKRDEEAVDTALLVFALITAARDELAFARVAPTEKDLSNFTKSPPINVPQLMVTGQIPSGADPAIE